MEFPDKNTQMGCRFLLQGIFPTQGQTRVSRVSCVAGRFLTAEQLGKPTSSFTAFQHWKNFLSELFEQTKNAFDSEKQFLLIAHNKALKDLKSTVLGLPQGSCGEDAGLPPQATQVRSLVGELRAHVRCVAKNNKQINNAQRHLLFSLLSSCSGFVFSYVLVAQMVNSLPPTRETQVPSLDQEDALEK